MKSGKISTWFLCTALFPAISAAFSKNFPTFEAFSNRHLIEPAQFPNGSQLTNGQLNIIFTQRANAQQGIDPGSAGDLRRKSSHIFFTGNPTDFKTSFGRGPYTTNVNEKYPMTNLGISSRSFPTTLLVKRGHSSTYYYTWACGSKYVIAGLNRFNEPMYLNAVQDSAILLFPFSVEPVLNPSMCSPIN